MADERLETTVRREQIAGAALAIIAEDGLDALSMNEVARRVGIVPSAIYRHFENREEMIAAALDYVVDKARGNIGKAVESSPDALSALRRLLLLQVTIVGDLKAIPRILFASPGAGGGRDRFRRKMRGVLAEILGGIEEIVKRGQREGTIRADLDPGTLAKMFWAVLPASTILTIHFGDEFDREAFAREAWLIVERALTPDAKKKRGQKK